MILIDYPGHIIACVSIIICILLVGWSFSSSNLKKIKLRKYLISSLTILSMVLLLIIMWNPSKMTTIPQTRSSTVQVFFDTSESMSIEDMDNLTRLDYAIELFNNKFNSNHETAPIYQYFGFDQNCYPVESLELLNADGHVSDLNISWDKISVQSMQSEMPGNISNIAGAIIFTDGQMNCQDVNNYTVLQDKDFPVLIIPVGSNLRQPDIGVTDFTAPPQVAIDTSYTASATIIASQMAGEKIVVEILQNNHVIDAKTIIPDNDNYSRNVYFELGALSTGIDKIEIVAKSGKLQELNIDNNHRVRLVKTIASQQRKILFYSQVASLDIGKIRQSLAKDKKVQLDFRLDAIVDPSLLGNKQNRKAMEFPSDSELLNEYDVLILGPMDYAALSEDGVKNLYDFAANRGGTVIFLPGKEEYDLSKTSNRTICSMLPIVFNENTVNKNQRISKFPVLTTDEGMATSLISSLSSLAEKWTFIPAYYNVAKKPAASTFLENKSIPFVCLHRLGRGYVSFMNSNSLYRLYSNDEQNCFLQELLSSLIAYTSRISVDESHIDLVSMYDQKSNRVVFESYVRDIDFNPVSGANVILDVSGQILKMQAGSSVGRYVASVDNSNAQSICATVKAEYGGIFLGQKMIISELPETHDEMSRTNANIQFLKDLARQTNAKYIEPEDVTENTISTYKSSFELENKVVIDSIWHQWPLLISLCGILTLMWFIRRSSGLV